MPHFPKPFFRKPRGAWYVQIDGKQHNLGPDRDEAFRRYHALMSSPKTSGIRVPSACVVAIIDAFLDWCEKNVALRTYEWYQQRAQLFVKSIPPDLLVRELKPYHLQRWIDAHPSWSPGSKRNGCRAVQRAMRWAEEQGLIDRSPLAHFKKPPQGRREVVVSAQEFERIVGCTRDREFRNFSLSVGKPAPGPKKRFTSKPATLTWSTRAGSFRQASPRANGFPAWSTSVKNPWRSP
jgi:hypothetical protein